MTTPLTNSGSVAAHTHEGNQHMSRLMRSTETMLRDIAGANIVAENKAAAEAAGEIIFATSDYIFPDGEPYFFRFPATARENDRGLYSSDMGKTWNRSGKTLGEYAASGYARITRKDMENSIAAAKFLAVSDALEKLTPAERREWIHDLHCEQPHLFADIAGVE